MAPQPCAWFNRTPSTSSGSEQIAFKVCGACKIVCYCSTGCQKSDWKYHKLVCKQYGEFMSSTPRPSRLYKLVLVFPVDTDSPAFRWVEFEYEGAGPESWEEPVHQPHLGPANSDGEVYFNRVEISKRLHLEFPTEQKYDLDHIVVAYVRDNWINDGTELNQSIEKMMNGERPMKWRGPMLALNQW